jgi:hypothetical protein
MSHLSKYTLQTSRLDSDEMLPANGTPHTGTRSGSLQLVDCLKSRDNRLGSLTDQNSYMYVGHLYCLLIKFTKHQPERVSLVRMISTFVELMDGAAWVCVRQEDYQTLLANTETEFHEGTRQAIKTTFQCGFMEVSN